MNQLYIGGLLRCCVESFDDYSPDQLDKLDEVKCKYCTGSIKKRPDGDWEWEGYKERRKREP